MLLLNTAQGIVAAADLGSVRQRENLLALVQVHEVYTIWQGSYLIHNEPCIILWHRNLIKVNVLRSIKRLMINISHSEGRQNVSRSGLTYLNIPILVIKVRKNIILFIF